jgi:phage baseplate assembly protein W
MLFELRTPASKLLFKKKIKEAIAKWEPRVVITDITFIDDNSNMHAIDITISFYVVSDSAITGDVTINLERVR